MLTLTIVWITSAFLIGFGIYLWPKGDRPLALIVPIISLGYGLIQMFAPLLSYSVSLNVQLLDRFGVTLIVDDLSGYLIVTNAIITLAIIIYCWPLGKTAFFYAQMIILHGSLNAVFIGADFISIYVALEVISVAAFLLITYTRTDRAIWIGLRYLFVSNTAMLFYLIGAVQVYQASGSFAFSGLQDAPPEAIALILLGLLAKGGIFVSGLWLPMTHSEADTPISALLSGTVITTGIFPLIRCALLADNIGPILQIFSVATAVLGVLYAIVETDSKRLLAASTISQVGFVLATPAAAGFYALTHGLAKATLFLVAGGLPSRKFAELRQTSIPDVLWGAVVIATLSICGMPLLPGFEAKALVLKSLDGWMAIAMNVAAVGTAIALAKFIFLPIQPLPPLSKGLAHGTANRLTNKLLNNGNHDGLASALIQNTKPPLIHHNRLLAIGVLLGGLLLATGWHYQQYTSTAVIKALLTVGAGWVIYGAIAKNLNLGQPNQLEKLEHLMGGMSLILIVLMGMVLA